MLLQPVKIDTPDIKHEYLDKCILIHKFTNGNALVMPLTMLGETYIIDLKDTDYET